MSWFAFLRCINTNFGFFCPSRIKQRWEREISAKDTKKNLRVDGLCAANEENQHLSQQRVTLFLCKYSRESLTKLLLSFCRKTSSRKVRRGSFEQLKSSTRDWWPPAWWTSISVELATRTAAEKIQSIPQEKNLQISRTTTASKTTLERLFKCAMCQRNGKQTSMAESWEISSNRERSVAQPNDKQASQQAESLGAERRKKKSNSILYLSQSLFLQH